MNKLLVGLDLSIRSTGICIRINNDYVLLNLSDKVVKKTHPRIINNSYERISDDVHKDIKLVIDAELQAIEIVNIISKYASLYKIGIDDIIIGIEGISYGTGGSSSKYDIPITAAIIKNVLRKTFKKENIRIYAPMTLKKALTGYGRGTKEVMIKYYQENIDSSLVKMRGVKIDDVIDAYACTEKIQIEIFEQKK